MRAERQPVGSLSRNQSDPVDATRENTPDENMDTVHDFSGNHDPRDRSPSHAAANGNESGKALGTITKPGRFGCVHAGVTVNPSHSSYRCNRARRVLDVVTLPTHTFLLQGPRQLEAGSALSLSLSLCLSLSLSLSSPWLHRPINSLLPHC